MHGRVSPLAVLFVAVLLITGCSSVGDSRSISEPSAQQSDTTIKLKEVPGVPSEVLDLATEEVTLFDQPFPAGARIPETVLDLEPNLSNTEVIEASNELGESLRLRKTPKGVSEMEAQGADLEDSKNVEISVSEGMFFFDIALWWQCSWLHEYLQSNESGDKKARQAALDHLNSFPDLPHVRDYVSSVDTIQETIIHPLADGDLKPARSYHKQTCSDLS